DRHERLFDLAEDTIFRLDSRKGCTSAILLRFEMGTLSILGHSPMLTQCVGCGRQRTTPDQRVSFGLNEGGILCRSCRKGKTNVVGLSSDSWKTMVQFSSVSDHDEPVIITEGIHLETRSVMNQYLAHLLGYCPKLQKYITKIR
ncbi:MAG: DNA repair protein RecO C-terminal domain-containing protein, partial [Mariniblastus sp.]|nr:DNA repair protein RecO C-terminal domain-containing protein [Mariniblastus sp.]